MANGNLTSAMIVVRIADSAGVERGIIHLLAGAERMAPGTGGWSVTVLGSGTSSGVPVVACECAVCQSPDPRNSRLRSSIHLAGPGGESLLVDCGSDFRQQALHHRIMRLDALLLTHAHSDHISGIDELRLYNWKQGGPIPVYATAETYANLVRRFDYVFGPPPVGGGVPQLDQREIGDGPFDAIGLRIVPLPVMHGPLPVIGFRFGDFAYITDASHVPEDTIARIAGVKTLILNALRHRPHPTHLNIQQAVAIAQRVGADRTWFTHITHDLDHDATNAQLPPGIALAHDGLVFGIAAEAT